MYVVDNIALNSSENECCFRTRCRENQNTLFMFSKTFPKICDLCDMQKYCRVRWATDDDIIGHRKDIIYMWYV